MGAAAGVEGQMESDFDKEIDILLRKEGSGRYMSAQGRDAAHLDADELSAFAENALPDRSRQAAVLHLAGCDRCRKILSDVIMVSEAAEPAQTAAAAAAPQATVPWYRRIFLTPNLAYVMGALVVVFAGFLGYTLLLSPESSAPEVSQVANSERAFGGPSAASDEGTVSASANTAANTANAATITASNSNAARNSAVNFNSSTAPPAEPLAEQPVGGNSANAAPAPMADTTTTSAAPPPRPSPFNKDGADLAQQDQLSREKRETLPAAQAANQAAEAPLMMRSAPADKPAAKSRSIAPSREARSQRMDAAGVTENESAVKHINGKTFELKQGVWYDTAYNGQRTTNIRRGSEEFKKLDAPLRSIADSLGGTSVILWNAKAYRFQ